MTENYESPSCYNIVAESIARRNVACHEAKGGPGVGAQRATVAAVTSLSESLQKIEVTALREENNTQFPDGNSAVTTVIQEIYLYI